MEMKKVTSHSGKGMKKKSKSGERMLKEGGSCLENEAADRSKLCIEENYRMTTCDWASPLFPPGTNYVSLDQQAQLEITATHL